MRIIKLLLQLCGIISSVFGQHHVATPDSDFKYQLGYCEPFTLQFVAPLLRQQIWNWFSPPQEAPRRELRFDLYTRANPNQRQILRVQDTAMLDQSNFNAAVPTRLVIHGWCGRTTTCHNAAIKDAYLSRGDFNLILVDWSDYALNLNYIGITLQMREIAERINDFTRLLHSEKRVAFADIYLIGHSVGCHIAGLAGKQLKPDVYGVIYALEPGGAPHSFLMENWHLAPSDAAYVESIQTDAIFGYPNANVAQATFFPNWGVGQPHCSNGTVNEPDILCDHFAALYYFVESIRRADAFGALRCKDFHSLEQLQCGCESASCEAEVFMGGEPAMPKRGVYYLSTQRTTPYGYGAQVRVTRPRPQSVLALS